MVQAPTFHNLIEDDLDEIMEIEMLSFTTPWSRYAFIHEIEFPGSVFKVIKIEGKLVGYGGFWHIVDEAHISNIAIHPEYRRREFGRKLLVHLLELAVERRATKATLEVRRSNTAAQRLYGSFGFDVIAVRKNYYSDEGEDALIMWNEDIAESLESTRKSRA
jgi:ribosomal-protein-alanine N-acetyltransferase